MTIVLIILVCLVVLLLWVWGDFSWGSSLAALGTFFSDALSFNLSVEQVSLCFLVMIACCGFIALVYSYHYFDGSEFIRVYHLLLWFLATMCCLSLTGSVLLTLVFWEYLGLVSFFLIILYGNDASLRASLISLIISRLGDVALFFLVTWLSWWYDLSLFNSGVFLLLVIYTKSAVYPFIPWLLEAMRAPTPVSSLVHSATLVAAGVWFLLRYSPATDPDTLALMLISSLVAILITGCCALIFIDLKKILALSTCNNISWCLLFFACGDVNLALVQLLTHGVCKCYLFIALGDLMSASGSSQSSRSVFPLRNLGLLSAYLHVLLIESLCGVIFLGSFFSKHVLASGAFYVYSYGFSCTVFVGFILSYAYSFRFALLLLKGLSGLNMGHYVSFVWITFLAILGTIFNFLATEAMSETIGLSGFGSIAMIMAELFGAMVGWIAHEVSNHWWRRGGPPRWASSLVHSDSVVSSLFRAYLSLTNSCILFVYRWELYLSGVWHRLVGSFLSSRFSFNIFIFSVIVFLFFFFFLV